MSTVTDSGSVWYDAMSGDDLGAEEYIVAEQGDEEPVTPRASPRPETDSTLSQDGGVDEAEDEDETPLETPNLPLDRRTRLPQRTAGDEGSLFTVLKKNVGQVSVPDTVSSEQTSMTFCDPGSFKYRISCHIQRAIDPAATRS